MLSAVIVCAVLGIPQIESMDVMRMLLVADVVLFGLISFAIVTLLEKAKELCVKK